MPEGMLLLGGGGHCRSVIDVLEARGMRIAGVIAPDEPEGGALEHIAYPVLGTDADLPALRARYNAAMVTVGQLRSPLIRQRVYAAALQAGFFMPSVVSPLAYVAKSAAVGNGSVVMHHALINSHARIGVNCIINTKALVEHDSYVGDHCHIAVGAVVCGGVTVGAGSFIGAGAVVRQEVTIAPGSFVPMGRHVTRDFPDS